MTSALLQLAAVASLLGLALLGALVVWIQFTSWLQVNGVNTTTKAAENRIDQLGLDGLANMFSQVRTGFVNPEAPATSATDSDTENFSEPGQDQ